MVLVGVRRLVKRTVDVTHKSVRVYVGGKKIKKRIQHFKGEKKLHE